MFKFVERAKFAVIVPLVAIILGIIFLGVGGGFVQDVDFAGGMTMYVEMGKEVDFGEVADVVKSPDGFSVRFPRTASARLLQYLPGLHT